MDAAAALPMRAVREALARDSYERDFVRIADPDLTGYSWLVASPQGIFAVAAGKLKRVIYGWFFGICEHGSDIYLFENCGRRGVVDDMGRIVRLRRLDGSLGHPAVLAKGLHGNCHQLAVIDDLLCVVDSANQAVVRFTSEGRLADTQRPFPAAEPSDTSGAYLHMNSIAEVDGKIAVMLHNGAAVPEKASELAWLDREWNLLERQPLAGHSCHDIVEDERGVLWHSASMSGEIIGSDGTRVKITDEMMTRGIAITADHIAVGVSTFGPRHIREKLRGAVVILDRSFERIAEVTLPGAPTDILPL